MKRILLMTAVLAIVGVSAIQANAATINKKNKLSYSMGYETGRVFRGHGVNINAKVFSSGMQDGLKGNPTKMTKKQIQQTLAAYQKQTLEKLQKKIKKAAKKNRQAAQKFLAANKNKSGVVTTKSGLQYKVIKKGTGSRPSKNSTVTVNYEGKLVNGKVFDSSYRRGRPATFSLKGVIKGWQEVIPMMKAGSTWMIYLPPKLAYGSRGAPGMIGPNEVLIFKVNLISVKK